MFEYKVRARHKLGWKEFKLYADTDIEEFFNRKSIEYVRNMTDTIENKQQQEIERLNNIKQDLLYVLQQIDGYLNKGWTIDLNFTDIREKYKKEIENYED